MATIVSSGAKQFHAELGVSVHEDLMDRIINKSPLDTPLFSMTPDGGSTGTIKVEYLTDTTTGGFASNINADGADYVFSTPGNRSRAANYCQLLTTTWKVGKLIDKADQAGLTSEYSYQMTKAMGNHGLACEYAVTYGTSATGASSTTTATGSSMAGYIAHILTYTASATGSDSANFTVSAVNTIVQNIVTNTTGKPSLILLAPVLKASASGWALPATKNINVEDKRYVASIAVYDGDFALFTFQWDRWLSEANSPSDNYNRALILDMETWKKVTYFRTQAEEVAVPAFARAGAMNTCFTILALAEQCNGMFLGSKQ